jgi:kynureninase
MNDLSLQQAQQLDAEDPLQKWRGEFWIPVREDGAAEVYLVGNSLGLQPKRTAQFVQEELEKWQRLGVRGHFESEFPWMPYHEFLAEPMANLVGAKPEEVVIMNGLTVNLHLMLATFYRPSKQRHKILIEADAFPSDYQVAQSQIQHHGFDLSESLVVVTPPEGQATLDEDALCEQIRELGDSLAVVMLPGVQYYTGQVIDMARVAEAAHSVGAIIGLDLAHAAGNIPLSLHDWNIDFAAWCSYKYLNSGPGSVAGCFVHRKHAANVDLPRLAGWWGHDKKTRFEMKNEFHPIPTAEGWQLSNPPILSMAAVRASLSVFEEAGGIEPLCEKSLKLTAYFQDLLEETLGDRVNIITPTELNSRGCQLSLELKGVAGRSIQDELESRGMMTDWREPNVIRAAPVPLYNSFEDVFRFVETLGELVLRS